METKPTTDAASFRLTEFQVEHKDSHAVHYSSKKESWCTPFALLVLAERVLGAPLYFDPCSNADALFRPQVWWDVSTEGLRHPWPLANKGGGWVNPPYGPKLQRWSKKIATEADRGCEFMTLLPARTETTWWHDASVPSANAFCFYNRRLHFVGASSCAPFPSVTTYHGPRPQRFVEIFSELGWSFVTPQRNRKKQFSFF